MLADGGHCLIALLTDVVVAPDERPNQRALVTQGLELGGDGVRRAVERPSLGGLARILEVWTLRQLLGAAAPRHAGLNRLFILGLGHEHVEGARHCHAHGVERATVGLYLGLEER